MKEIANYRSFLKICEQLVQIDEKICDLRPVGEPENNSGLEALRKELQTRPGLSAPQSMLDLAVSFGPFGISVDFGKNLDFT